MFSSIIDDFKQSFAIGNMVSKLILVNVVIGITALVLSAFSYLVPFNTFIDNHLSVPSALDRLLWNPWTLLTYMFIHAGIWHLLWNMVTFHLFGRIVGDLLGDSKVLPLYIFGGLVAALVFILSSNLMGINSICVGASGCIMAFALVAALIAPDYSVGLLFLGEVKIKYIVLAFFIIDIISSQGFSRAGGHFAQLGGALAGLSYVSLYKKNIDVLKPISSIIDFINGGWNKKHSSPSNYRPVMKVAYKANNARQNSKIQEEISVQERIDVILDKINEKGYEKLSQEEKDFLKKASKDA